MSFAGKECGKRKRVRVINADIQMCFSPDDRNVLGINGQSLIHQGSWKEWRKREIPFKTGSDAVGNRFCGAPFSFRLLSFGRAKESRQGELEIIS